jgi:hypothetical protein
VIARLLRRFRVQRYADPSLHRGGDWGDPVIDGRNGRIRVSWTRPVTRVHGGPHEHVVKTCTIGPEMAHTDKCYCGSERYGVFGTWS